MQLLTRIRCRIEELSVSSPTISLSVAPTNSAIEAPYQNRNDAAFVLTAGVASSITRSIAERRSDCATQGDRQSVVLSPAEAQKFECRAEDSNFGHSGSRAVGDR